jgi:hypothetical protein
MSGDIVARVFDAAMSTSLQAGPPPLSHDDAQQHLRRWCALMRLHDPTIANLSDREIEHALERI